MRTVKKYILHAIDENGFTIQELMVVIVISSLLVSFSFSALLFSRKLFGTWQKNHEVRSTVNRVVQAIALDVFQSKQLQSLTDSSLVLKKINGSTVRYIFRKKNIQRNEDFIVNSDEFQLSIKVTEMTKLRNQNSPPLLNIKASCSVKGIYYFTETYAGIPANGLEAFIRTSTGSD